MKKTVILGGGITGLVSAYFASLAGDSVTVIEAGNKPGGLLATFEIAGIRLEKFYHHFFTHDAELNWLCKELGLENSIKYYNGSMGIHTNGKTQDFNSPVDLLNFNGLSILDKIRFGLTSVYLSSAADWKKYEGISIYEWFTKFAGENTTETIWAPLLKVKFGPYFDKVPVSWMIGRLSQRVKSRTSGKEKLGYMDGSTQTLVNGLTSKLHEKGVVIQTNSQVRSLNILNGKLIELKTDTASYEADTFISTIPTSYLSNLVRDHSLSYADELDKIEYFGALCVVLELTEALSETYWINVASENFSFGGIIEHTNLVPPSLYNNHHVVYLSRYFSHQENIAKLTDNEIKDLMYKDLCRIYPKFNKSLIINSFLFKTDTAATVCDLNFSKKVPQVKTPIQNLYTVGMPHVYQDERSVNNSIRIAANACKVAGIDTSYVPSNHSLSGLVGTNQTN